MGATHCSIDKRLSSAVDDDGTETMRVRIPSYVGVKHLARLLRVPVSQVLKDVTVNARKKVFVRGGPGGSWLEFKSPRDVVLPYAFSAGYSRFLGATKEEEVAVEEEDYRGIFSLLLSKHEQRRRRIAVAVLLGQGDHGKTTLLQQLSQERHFLESEGADGMTQTIRTVYTKLASTGAELTLVDTPGQDLFYRMRNYGASVADSFVLVIAADEGIQEQTKESIGIIEKHLSANRDLAPRILVVINKTDLLPVEPSAPASSADILARPRLQQLVKEIRDYEALSDAAVVAVSAKSGANLDDLRALLANIAQGQGQAQEGEDDDDSKETGWGVGTVLNVEQSTQRGVVMHVLLLRGRAAVGWAFSAGGWSGVVRGLVDPPKSSSSSLKQEKEQELVAGQGAKLSVSLAADCGEPLPLGSEVVFLPAQERPLLRLPQLPLVSLLEHEGREVARLVAEQVRLEHAFESHVLSPDTATRFRLPQPKFALPAVEVQVQAPAMEEKSLPTEEEENSKVTGPLVVLKTDTHISLHTVLDAIDDAVAAGATPTATIIRHGAGDVTPTDMFLAKAAGATVLMYKVRILKGRNGGGEPSAPVKRLSKLPDVVDYVLGLGTSRRVLPSS